MLKIIFFILRLIKCSIIISESCCNLKERTINVKEFTVINLELYNTSDLKVLIVTVDKHIISSLKQIIKFSKLFVLENDFKGLKANSYDISYTRYHFAIPFEFDGIDIIISATYLFELFVDQALEKLNFAINSSVSQNFYHVYDKEFLKINFIYQNAKFYGVFFTEKVNKAFLGKFGFKKNGEYVQFSDELYVRYLIKTELDVATYDRHFVTKKIQIIINQDAKFLKENSLIFLIIKYAGNVFPIKIETGSLLKLIKKEKI